LKNDNYINVSEWLEIARIDIGAMMIF